MRVDLSREEGDPWVSGSIRGHIVIFAARDIEPGEEVTYDYKFPVEAAKIQCLYRGHRARRQVNEKVRRWEACCS